MSSWISLVVGVVPPVATLVGRFIYDARDTGAVSRIEKHAALIEKLPDDVASPLTELLKAEVGTYANRRLRKTKRKLDKSSLAALIFVAILTGLWLGFGVTWSLKYWGLWFVVVPVGLLGLGLMGAGVSQLYKYDDEIDGNASPGGSVGS